MSPRRLFRCRHGNAALLFAVLSVPLVLSIGAAIDFGRVQVATQTLQSIVDAAAMAGGAVFSDHTREQLAIDTARAYFNKGAASLPDYAGAGEATVTTVKTLGCGDGAAQRISVAASVSVNTTLMGIAVPSMTVAVSATAAHPLVEFYLDVTDFNSDAIDDLRLWWYRMPAGDEDPEPSDLEFIIGNKVGGTPEVKACVSPDQKIGFALSNQPGWYACYYGGNEYGGTCDKTYHYYSTLFPPSKNAYPLWMFNSALQIVAVPTDGSKAEPKIGPFEANPPDDLGYFPADASAYAPVAANGAVSCNDLDGRAIRLYWNDMGGLEDEHDYNDAVITFSCSSVKTGSVHLER